MLAAGWQVVIADRDEDALMVAVQELGGKAMPAPVDIADIAGVRKMVGEVVHRTGRFDGLVNNAGVFRNEPLLDTDEATYDRIMDINVKGAFFMLQAAAKAMLEAGNGGVIVNVASAAGRSGRPTQTVYGMSKASLIHLTKSAAIAFAPHVRVCCVCPAAVDTDMMVENLAQRRAVGGEADAMGFLARIPMGRMSTPQEVADLIAYLMSEKASYITGGSIDISGGLDMH
ncbi:MAG: SDR family oxidoreductase [Armatimonadaceae bacterium]